MDNRDEILMNFQACTGLENIAECISVLERNDWDLVDAINSVSNLFEDHSPDIHVEGVAVPMNTGAVENISPVEENAFCSFKEPITTQPIPFGDASTSDGLSVFSPGSSISERPRPSRLIHFKIEYRDRNISLVLPDSEKVYRIKQLLEDEINIPPESMELLGWPQKKAENKTILHDLNLPLELTLYVLTPTIAPGVTVDASNGEQSNILERLSQNFTLNVFYKDQNRHYPLNFPGSKTIQEVKGDVYSLIDVPMSQQVWTGWPDKASDETMTLAGAGIGYPCHNLEVSKAQTRTRRNQPVDPTDHEMSDEEEDCNFILGDDIDLSHDDDAAATHTRLKPLIAEEITDETAGVECFSARFAERYGECHPVFYIGTLENAIKEALLVKAKERKLLAIYLHHDRSILGNIFCSQMLCTESVVQYLSNNFLVWPWDFTNDVHRNKLLELCTQHFGTVGSNTVRNFKVNQLPLVIIITRTRSANEVFTAIPGSVSLDELMTNLINAVDVFQEQLKVEVVEEEERELRERVKNEQDLAYQESLEADRKKVETKRLQDEARFQREIDEEKKRAEQEALIYQEKQMKEARRLSIKDTLPDEPPADSREPITCLRLRCPDGKMFTRRFLIRRPLQIVLNYVVSQGYHLEDYKVLTTYPRRDLTALDPTQTIETLNLYPQETLILEER